MFAWLIFCARFRLYIARLIASFQYRNGLLFHFLPQCLIGTSQFGCSVHNCCGMLDDQYLAPQNYAALSMSPQHVLYRFLYWSSTICFWHSGPNDDSVLAPKGKLKRGNVNIATLMANTVTADDVITLH